MRNSFLSSAPARIPIAALAAIALGGAVHVVARSGRAAFWTWAVALVVLGAPVVWRTLRDAFKGRFATDMVAML
ncbi:MAG TPA: hypothetical protein VG818_02970, partial [Gemmatimonadaceae bacterium]|nr:hypothetical protein [Gemmatimonadaceae bacterium]